MSKRFQMVQVSKSLMKKCTFSCKSMEVNLRLDEIRPYLSTNEYKRVISIKSKNLALQKAHAYYLIKKLIDNDAKDISVEYLQNGKPYIKNKDIDISISHKEDIVYVGIAQNPYRVGVDIEPLNQTIDINILKNHYLNTEEINLLKIYSFKYNLSIESVFIIFWSIKESFFKCLGYDIKPKEICIKDISDDGKVILSFSQRINELMKILNLEFVEIDYNKKYVYARTLMKKVNTKTSCL